MKTTDILIKSGFLHVPLPLSEYGKGDIAVNRLHTEVYEERPITGVVSSFSRGELSDIEHGYRVDSRVSVDAWPEHLRPYGNYCNYGAIGIKIQIAPEEQDWRKYTRVRFSMRAIGMANRSPHIFAHVVNEGEVPLPDRYHRVGGQQICLEYGEWNDCVWEIAEMPRDKITCLDISMSMNGSDNVIGDTAAVEIKDIRLQVCEPFVNYGWQCRDIAYSQVGYRLKGRKDAVVMAPCETFTVEEKGGEQYTFQATPLKFKGQTYYMLDFTSINRAGVYRIHYNDRYTEWFDICEEPFTSTMLKLCNFIFCERCGYPIPGKHSICHGDILAQHDGKTAIFNGGWHDAADMSQQAIQTGEIASSLYAAADAARKAGDEPLAVRLYEEARWGMAFVIKTRFGDGYRAASAGLIRFTRSFIGDMDDIPARVNNNPFENLLFSAIELDAAMHEKEYDRSLSEQLFQAAKEDFAFGVAELPNWKEKCPNSGGHTRPSSYSLHMAAAIYAGAGLLRIEEDEKIRGLVESWMDELLSCQETSSKYAVNGFFYRDATHTIPVHFNHQSREHLFGTALAIGYEVLTGERKERVYTAMTCYGRYLKALMGYASPYRMIPAGVYLSHEAEDEESFQLMHIGGNFAEEKGDIFEQIQNGTPIGEGAYIRQFPVWLSFRGNAAVLLSQGMSARILSKVLQDDALSDIANDQLYFMCGKNPFAQSLIYGEGVRYAPLYASEPGQMIGATPVGMQSDLNFDEPSYPETINATYKEVWTSPAARFMGAL